MKVSVLEYYHRKTSRKARKEANFEKKFRKGTHNGFCFSNRQSIQNKARAANSCFQSKGIIGLMVFDQKPVCMFAFLSSKKQIKERKITKLFNNKNRRVLEEL